MTNQQLSQRRCQPCEGGVDHLNDTAVGSYLAETPGWELGDDGRSIAKPFNCKDFLGALQKINSIGRIAEDQQHHPDLHLTGYRHLKVVLTTHAIGGLSENDFILAAKIDEAFDQT